MTLIELLRFVQNNSDKCLFVLYYELQSGSAVGLTTPEIRDRLAKCRVKQHKNMNISDVMSRANHFVDRSKDGHSIHKWHLTASGIEHVQSRLIKACGTLPVFGGGKIKVISHKKIAILFLGLAPLDTQRIRIDKETREIEEKLRSCEYRDVFKLHSKWAVRTKDLFQHIHEINPDILHISGHGTATGEIAFEDDHGKARLINPSVLSKAISSIESNIRVALFNLCYSNNAAKESIGHLDCSIGMNGPIDDESAVVFASSFYRSLGFGKSVISAFREARASLVLEGLPGDHLLELNVRNGVDAGEVYLAK